MSFFCAVLWPQKSRAPRQFNKKEFIKQDPAEFSGYGGNREVLFKVCCCVFALDPSGQQMLISSICLAADTCCSLFCL